MNRLFSFVLLSSFALIAFSGGSSKKKKQKQDPKIITPPKPNSTPDRERVSTFDVKLANVHAQLMQLIYKSRTPDSGPYKDTEQECKPEEWTVDDILTKDFQEQAKKVRVYYKAGESLKDVKKLTRHREPVNIGMDRQSYNEVLLKEKFGYKEGAYEDSTNEKLMPNIAIFTPARIQSDGKDIKDLNVINLIGAGFDVPSQPDYKYYLESEDTFKEDKKKEFKNRMKMMYRFAFHHAKENNLQYIQHAGVGEGHFGGKVQKKVAEIRELVIEELKKEYEGITIVSKDGFFVPDHLFERNANWDQSMTNDNTLFINAWDPWSMVGNGNKGDDSLDGRWGRISNMAYLAWPFTNFYLDENHKEFNSAAYVAVPETIN